MDVGDEGTRTLSPEDRAYASQETLHSSLAFLQETLASMGMCEYIDLMSNEPADVVSTCNTIYGLLLQHQRDAKFKEQLKQELQRSRVELQTVEKERSKLESRLEVKEREIGGLMNRNRTGDDARKEEVTRARREAEELQKRLLGCERRVVQMQHEMKRRELEYEKLQERLSHYLADKKRSENAALAMAGQLTQSSNAPAARNSSHSGRSDEGIKAVITAYEGKNSELSRENKDLRAALTALQGEYKEALNAAVARREADAAAGPVVEESFLKEVPHMHADELRAELSSRLKSLQRRLANLSWRPGAERGEQHLASDLAITRSVIRDQELLITGVLGALRSAYEAAEAHRHADAKALVQRYQGRLAAAEADLQRGVAAFESRLEAETGRLKAEADEKLLLALTERDEALARAEEAQATLAHSESARVLAIEDAERAMETRLASAIAETRSKAEAEMALMAGESSELQMSLKREQAALRAETGALRERLMAEKSSAEKALLEKEQALACVVEKVQTAEQRARMRAEDSFRAMLEIEKRAVEDAKAELEAAMRQAHEEKASAARAAEERHAALLSELSDLRRAGIEERAALEKEAVAQRDAAVAEAIEEREEESKTLRKQIIQLQGSLESLEQQIRADRAATLAKAESDFAEEREELIRKAASLHKQLTAERASCEKLRSESELAGIAVKKLEGMTHHYKELMGKYAPGLGAGLFLEKAVERKAAALAGMDINAVPRAARGMHGRRG